MTSSLRPRCDIPKIEIFRLKTSTGQMKNVCTLSGNYSVVTIEVWCNGTEPASGITEILIEKLHE
jgi:hypothetical protein